MREVAYGLCHCGCGNPAPISATSCRRDGWIKGQPKRFIHGHHARSPLSPATRFEQVVTRTGDDACWPWGALCNDDGYGRFWDGETTVLAHRFAWTHWRGPIPARLCVLHTCDNPPCCNPRHLFLGTQADNMADCITKGRNSPPPNRWAP